MVAPPPGGDGGERWATQPRNGEAGGDGDTHSTNEVQEIGDMPLVYNYDKV